MKIKLPSYGKVSYLVLLEESYWGGLEEVTDRLFFGKYKMVAFLISLDSTLFHLI